MKVVFDTNVLLAAFVSKEGLCSKILKRTLAKSQLAISEYILEELSQKLSLKFHFSHDEILHIVDSLRSGSALVIPLPISMDICRDPTDLPILGTAAAAKADVIVTGDNDLLTLGHYMATQIITPRTFFDLYIGIESENY